MRRRIPSQTLILVCEVLEEIYKDLTKHPVHEIERLPTAG